MDDAESVITETIAARDALAAIVQQLAGAGLDRSSVLAGMCQLIRELATEYDYPAAVLGECIEALGLPLLSTDSIN